MAADTHHLLNSVSKTFLGMLVGQLAAEGLLDLTAPLPRYVPQLANTAFAATTLQHALDMTAAVAFNEDYDDANSDFWQEAAVVGWQGRAARDRQPQTLLDFAAAQSATQQTDGDAFVYRTVLTDVLGMAVQAATGTPLQTTLATRLWQRLRPEQDACVVVDSGGFPYFGAGMSACARDLARFGELLLADGRVDGETIVPASWVRQTRLGSDRLRALFGATDYALMRPGGHYHNHTWASQEGLLLCSGIHGQNIYTDQRTGVVIVKLSSQPQPVDLALFAETIVALDALSLALRSEAPAPG